MELICVNKYSTNRHNIADESNTIASSSSSNNKDICTGGGSSGSGINITYRFNQETTSLYNDSNLSHSKTNPVVKKIKLIRKLINVRERICK